MLKEILVISVEERLKVEKYTQMILILIIHLKSFIKVLNSKWNVNSLKKVAEI